MTEGHDINELTVKPRTLLLVNKSMCLIVSPLHLVVKKQSAHEIKKIFFRVSLCCVNNHAILSMFALFFHLESPFYLQNNRAEYVLEILGFVWQLSNNN